MTQGLLARDPPARHPVQHPLNQVGRIDYIVLEIGWITNDATEVASLDVVQFVDLVDCMLVHLWRHVPELISRWEPKDGYLLD